jgi:hypothetical protein
MLLTSSLNAMTDSQDTKLITVHRQPYPCGYNGRMLVRVTLEKATPARWDWDSPLAPHEATVKVYPGQSAWLQRSRSCLSSICSCEDCYCIVWEVIHAKRIKCETPGFHEETDIYYDPPIEYKWNECEQLETDGARKFFEENPPYLSDSDDE